MRVIVYLVVACCVCVTLCGCGGAAGGEASPVVGADVIHTYKMTITGEASATTITLPQQFTDLDWASKALLCHEAGYNLATYAGQVVTLTSYGLVRKYKLAFPLSDINGVTTVHVVDLDVSAYLWVISKDGKTIGAYLALNDSSVPLFSLQEV